MCTKGTWHLTKVNLRYCPIGGSSFGTREFIRNQLTKFATANPQIKIVAFPQRGKHPAVEGLYEGNHKVPRVVDLRNKKPDEIMKQLMWLRGNDGSKVGKFNKQVYSSTPSIQGEWTVDSKLKDIPVIVKSVTIS
jgi:hypothetical protein